ncbi:MAG: GspH/FimT family pseudopilin [Candidatus Aminicenantaceae bacterium]|nr:GspH/FimT family pseudopilin [Candidatus Heimdallarchaeota archaeon]
MNKRTYGFSLIEVVISIAILGLFITLLSHSFTNQAPKYQLKKATWEIYSRLNYARYKAIYRGMKYKVSFESNSYVLEKFDDPKGEWRTEQRSFLEGVTITANNSPIFHPRGTVSNLASITVENSRGQYKISIAISGRIKVTEM